MVGVVAYFAVAWQRELPDHGYLLEYEPAMQTRIYAGDGALLAEYGRQRRFHIPYDAIPPRVAHAFLAAEDKNFFRHRGLDPLGIVRAVAQNVVNVLEGRRPVGASTITQQVAKNFLLTREVSIERKGKEALLALSIERALSKQRILELYLNEIYLGFGSYGVAAAALNYFGKSLDELTIAEAAYLAALAKGPANYHPTRSRERALERRDWVIARMLEDERITQEQASEAWSEELRAGQQPDWGARISGAEYFVEEIRRRLHETYGENALYEGGMLVRSTLSPRLQDFARAALRNGLVAYDRRHGWRGAVASLVEESGWERDWQEHLARIEAPADLAPWQLAVVLEVGAEAAAIGVQGKESIGAIPFAEMEWAAPWKEGQRIGAKPKRADEVLAAGDVVYVERLPDGDTEDALYTLRQLPDVNGALVALDPFTGRVLAMQGGFSHADSEFNRAWQAYRQPGSAFKPFVYAVALERGYSPASIVLDAPVAIDPGYGQKVWKPKNYTGKYNGPSTLRVGIEQSRNAMTVRLAYALGMEEVAEALREFELMEEFPPYLPTALGSGETSLMRMVSGYAAFVNGGHKVTPTLIDRIQDRYGRSLYRFDVRDCAACAQEQWRGQRPPNLRDERAALLSPQTAYQMVSMLEGVALRGTGRSLRVLERPIAGKTGTTNEERDAWFVGFSPDLAVGVYVGFDEPQPLGYKETGGRVAAPIFREFMGLALAEQQPVPFRVPAGIRLMTIERESGVAAPHGSEDGILEAFKIGGPGPNVSGEPAPGVLAAAHVLEADEILPGGLFRAPGEVGVAALEDAPADGTEAALSRSEPAGRFDGGLY